NRTDMSTKDLRKLWTELGGKDARAAYRAVVLLGQDRAKAPDFLAAQLRRLSKHDPEHVRKLIVDLENSAYEIRAKAQKELVRLEDIAAHMLCEALAINPPLETKCRIENVLAQLDPLEMSPRQIHVLRAMEALERAATPAARKWFAEAACGSSLP